MMTCQKCGKSVPDSATVCPICGVLLGHGPEDATGPVHRPEAPSPKFESHPSHGSGGRVLFAIAGVLFVAVAVVLVGYFALGWRIGGKKGAYPGVSQSGGSAVEAKFQTLQEMADNIDKLETDMQQKGQQMAKLQNEYQSKGGQLRVGGVALNDDERKLLADLMKDEKTGYKDLLQEILAKDKEIWDAKTKLTALEEQLPKPHVVKEGERHRQIAITFLMKTQGLSQKQAEELSERVNLLDPLLPGFKVWCFYIDGAFGTYVTQGTAPISPNEAERQKIQQVVDERNAAIGERDALKVQVSDLDAQKTQLTDQVTGLTQERDSLNQNISELKTIQSGLESDVNSLYFRAGSKKELEAAGIIKDPFFGSVRMENFKTEDFTGKIDLRSQTTIVLAAETCNVKKIKKVAILPSSMFKDKIDYRVDIPKDGMQATITILNPDKFHLQKIVIAVE